MEKELREFLLAIARQYAIAAKVGLSTVGRRCRRDSSFFTRIAGADGSFAVRTFDEAIAWFEANWPEGADRPSFKLVVPAEQAA